MSKKGEIVLTFSFGSKSEKLKEIFMTWIWIRFLQCGSQNKWNLRIKTNGT